MSKIAVVLFVVTALAGAFSIDTSLAREKVPAAKAAKPGNSGKPTSGINAVNTVRAGGDATAVNNVAGGHGNGASINAINNVTAGGNASAVNNINVGAGGNAAGPWIAPVQVNPIEEMNSIDFSDDECDDD
jgi:hypothetical protein